MANIRKLQENTAALCKMAALHLGRRYQMIRICPSGEVETPPLPFGSWIPDMNIRVESGRQPGAKWWSASGCKMVAHIRVQIGGSRVQFGGSWVQFLPGYVCSDALLWCIRTPCPGMLLAWIPKNSPQSWIALMIKKAIKTPKLNTFFIRIDCKGP